MERVEASGEMRHAAGKPLPLNDGFDQTPEELRMAYKALKNALSGHGMFKQSREIEWRHLALLVWRD